MKAGISNIWLLGMIATFIFIFSCYVIISVNYTKSFKMKNEVLTIIEKGKGMTGLKSNSTQPGDTRSSIIVPGENVRYNVTTFQTISLYLSGSAYQAMGHCPSEGSNVYWYGVKSLDLGNSASKWELANANKKYYYCFAKFIYNQSDYTGGVVGNNDGIVSYYYKVRLFYKMELPVLDNWLAVRVDGETNEIYEDQMDNGNMTISTGTSDV